MEESAGTWATGVEAGLPADAATSNTSPIGRMNLNSVSCASAGNCSAVGYYWDSSGNLQGLLMTETAGTWATGVKAHLPVGAGTNPGVDLTSVSCSSAGNCAAAGDYTDSSGNVQGLLVSESSGTWQTGVKATLPSGPATNPQVSLTSVSCPSVGECGAVGDYRDSAGNLQGLLLSQSSGTWGTGVKLTAPGDVMPSPFSGISLTSVSCASAGDCSAVGHYLDSSDAGQGLLVGETGGTWGSGIRATPPANAGADGDGVRLSSVSCSSAGNCGAVGEYIDTSGGFAQEGLLLDESGGTWGTGVEAVLPGDAASPNAGAFLYSISCPSAGTCSAVGVYGGSVQAVEGVLLSESAGTWASGVTAALPAGASLFDGNNAALSCSSAANCSAVGEWVDGSGNHNGLMLNETPGTLASPALSASAPSSGVTATRIAASSVSGILSGGSSPSGTITFRVFGPQSSPPTSCTSGGARVGTAGVSGNGTYHPSAGFTPASPGSYWWYASYGGDPSNNAVASACGAAMPKTVVTPPGTGGVPSPPGGGSGSGGIPGGSGAMPPVLSAARIVPKRFAVTGRRVHGRCVTTTRRNRTKPRCRRPIDATVSYQLNVSGQLTVTITKMVPGTLVKGRCVTSKRNSRRRRRCRRSVHVPGKINVSGTQGANRFTFTGQIGGRTLAVGRYLLTLTPTASGLAGTPQTVPFTIAA